MAIDHTNLIKKTLIALCKLPNTRAWQVDCGVARSMDGLRIIKFGLKGHSDIYCLNNGRSLFVEIKIGPDKQREDQINFQKMVKNCGGLYFLIRSENDLEEMLREL